MNDKTNYVRFDSRLFPFFFFIPALVPRLRATAVSFAVVLGAFWLYKLTAAPWLDPQTTWKDTVTTATPEELEYERNAANRLEPFQLLFPPGSWERDKPIILENEQAKFLFSDYENLRDGRVKMTRCAIVFLPDGEVDFTAPQKRIIVLQSAEGAILEFDQPIDLNRAKVGKLIGGVLTGQVTIRGTPSRPGANDELEVTARDVQLNEERLWTSQTVDARLGKHRMTGTELQIRFLPATGGGGKRRGPNVGGIDSLELARDVRMLLQPEAGGLLPGDRDRATRAGQTAAVPATQSTQRLAEPPLEIRCAGPFQFQFVERTATFEDQVRVLRLFPNGQTDQLNAAWLQIDFQPRTSGETSSGTGSSPSSGIANPPSTALRTLTEQSQSASTNSAANSATNSSSSTARNTSLDVRKLTARGSPVIVRAPSSQVALDSEYVEYDIQTGRIVLDGQQEIHLKQGNNEYHGRTVSYEPGANGALGRLAATGPGWFRAQSPDPTRGRLEARFATELKMRPHEQNHVISVLGQAKVNSTSFGELIGEEIHLWLIEAPSSAANAQAKPQTNRSGGDGDLFGARGSVNALPDRMLAQGNVSFLTPQIQGKTKRLEIWFDPVGTAAAAANPATNDARTAPRIVPIRTNDAPADPTLPALDPRAPLPAPFQPGAPNNALPWPAVGANIGISSETRLAGLEQPIAGLTAGVAPPSTHPGNQQPAAAAPPRYDVTGDLIRVQLVTRGAETALGDLTIDGALDFRELSPRDPSEQPLAVTGEHLEVLKADTLQSLITVTGKPAKLRARGLETSGETIKLDRGQNRVWIEGTGRLNLPESAPRPRAPQVPQAGIAPATNASSPLTGLSGPVVIDFAGGLNFDGQTITIDRDVLVTNTNLRSPVAPQSSTTPLHFTANLPIAESLTKETRTVRTQQVVVKLLERIDFQRTDNALLNPNRQRPANEPTAAAQVETLACNGGVVFETREDAADGSPLAWQQLQARDLLMFQTTGEVRGTGPGELVSVRRGSGTSRAVFGVNQANGNANGANPASSNPASASAAQHELQYLHVDFRRGFQGNLQRRIIAFDNQIEAVSGPVAGWTEKLDPDHPERLGPRGLALNCDQLIVAEAPYRMTGQQRNTVELQAVGNTIIEGANYTARAYRLTFAEAKDQLVLEGDGRIDAELNYQQAPGAPLSKAAAGKLMFWPGTNRVDVDKGRMIDLGQMR